MKRDTTAKIHQLNGPNGETATVTTGTAQQKVTFNMTNLPTGKDGRFFYYVKDIIVAVTVNATGTGASFNLQRLWQIVDSLYCYSPVLGTLAQHQNNRGSVVGLVQNPVSLGYSDYPHPNDISGVTGAVSRTLYYRIPFAHRFLADPMETAPWAGFLEGGTVEVLIAPEAGIEALATAGTYELDTVNVRCWLNLEPSQDARVHVPMHYREHTGIPASSTRFTITDIGAPDGLQGIDMGKGCGVAALMALNGISSLGLGNLVGGTTWGTADQFTSVDLPWRDQNRINCPDAFFLNLYDMMGPHHRVPSADTDYTSFPYPDTTSTPFTQLNNIGALVFPFIMPAADTFTSHLQTIAGAKDINFTQSGTPFTAPRLLGLYAPVFDDSFIANVLIPRITPDRAASAQLTAKTLNKQRGGVPGVGKLAYVARKINR